MAQAILLVTAFLLLASVPASPASPSCHGAVDAMYAFGDSTTDTGNAIRTGPGFQVANRPPYGNTFFGHPTGRFSDGKLMVDYLCDQLGVDLLSPHLQESGGGSQNFAVAGATALTANELQQLAGVASPSSYSLDTEMGWFHDAVNNRLSKDSVIYFGEIGGNDINYAFASRTSSGVVTSLIPHVMDKVNRSLEAIVQAGAQKIVVQGDFPMGCLPMYMKSMSGAAVDQHGCVKSVSSASDQHNAMLQQVVKDAQARHADVKFVYLDTTAAYLQVLDHASDYGFSNVKDACFDSSGGSCSDPRSYMSWDGIHLTDAMYHTLVGLFVGGGFSSPSKSFIGACD